MKIKTIMGKLRASLIYLAVTAWYTGMCFCGDVFEVATTASKNTQQKISDFAADVLPLLVIIAFLIIMFTRDERKRAAEIKWAFWILLAFAVISKVDTVINTVTGLIG